MGFRVFFTLWKSFFIIFLFSLQTFAARSIYITTGEDLAKSSSLMLQKSNFKGETLKTRGGISLMKISPHEIESLSQLAHESFKRCGGFIVHDSWEEAKEELFNSSKRVQAKEMIFESYKINQEEIVQDLLAEVQENRIREDIIKLSSFKNRYYKSQTGVDSQNWLFKKWKNLGKKRSDFKVKKWDHSKWNQPSLVATIKGKSDDVIIIGGHADSIGSSWWGRSRAVAPGADDNASGIATLTEAMRILLDSGYIPQKTIKFMAYAAEEVGLLGSKEIAREFREKGVSVIGALQLDMTNHKGSRLDIVLMSDYTNRAQNAFIGSLVDKYLPEVSWGYDRCGYACSDHASWHSQGFPASMPFESKMEDINHDIHTSKDTIDKSNGLADHAEQFAKLALAYIIELDY